MFSGAYSGFRSQFSRTHEVRHFVPESLRVRDGGSQAPSEVLTSSHIRTHGAIGNLNEGVVIQTHGVHTRLIAWPGNGFQTESVHVLTMKPGEESASYAYTMAEEVMICAAGRGEVFLLGRWVSVEPGDIAYFPEGVSPVRNFSGNKENLVLVSQITVRSLY